MVYKKNCELLGTNLAYTIKRKTRLFSLNKTIQEIGNTIINFQNFEENKFWHCLLLFMYFSI